ncbi:MAG TPA: ABC transporter ATP-binding protein [Candidatus Eisenbacteria bacterium]
MLQLDRIRKVYPRGAAGVVALDDISLHVDRGEFLSVMGPSGSGKSTLLNLVGCLDRPSSGLLTIDGVETTELDDDALTEVRRRRVAIIFQFYNLLPTLTAVENVALPRLLDGAREGDTTRRAEKLLERVGLAHRLRFRPDELSGGEMQRVAIARALMSEAPLLLADEPTGNLDSATAGSVMELLVETVREVGLTLVLVTHDAGVAARADRHVVIRDGRLVADDRRPAGSAASA